MEPNESVEDFSKRVRGLVNECYPMFAEANKKELIRDCYVMLNNVGETGCKLQTRPKGHARD
jgi:hypothetical protein